MRIPLHDIMAELGIGEMTDAEQIKNIPREKVAAVVRKIRARIIAVKEIQAEQAANGGSRNA